MNMCSKCQTEFEGDACPNCTGKESATVSAKNSCPVSAKMYKALSVIPAAVMLAFSVLSIIFMALPVASVKFYDLKEKFGSIFTAERFDEIAGLMTLSTIILVFNLVMLLFSIVSMARRYGLQKYYQVAGKPTYRLFDLLSLLFVGAELIFAAIVATKIIGADEGFGILRVSYYPVMSIIFSVIALLVLCCAIYMRRAYEKYNENALAEWVAERQAIIKKHGSLNQAAKKGSKRALVFLVIPVIIAATILPTFIGGAPLSLLTNRITASGFSGKALDELVIYENEKFLLDTFYKEKLGEPYIPTGSESDDAHLEYYTENYFRALGQLERYEKYAVLAIQNGDDNISSLLKHLYQLREEQQFLAYGKATIDFDGSHLSKIVYDAVVVDGHSAVNKKLDAVEIYKIYGTTGTSNELGHISSLMYKATYTDGSFIYSTAYGVSVVSEDGTEGAGYEGSYVGKTIKWTDEFGAYEVLAPNK